MGRGQGVAMLNKWGHLLGHERQTKESAASESFNKEICANKINEKWVKFNFNKLKSVENNKIEWNTTKTEKFVSVRGVCL